MVNLTVDNQIIRSESDSREGGITIYKSQKFFRGSILFIIPNYWFHQEISSESEQDDAQYKQQN